MAEPPGGAADEHSHTPEAIARRLAVPLRHSYLRDFVYGGIDGAVTTFAIVSGAFGARLSAEIVLILGLANLVADGFSMAAANYLATRTEKESVDRLEAVEQEHITRFPEGEREEIRQIFRRKGLEGETLEKVVEAVTSDRDRWVETMLSDEYGVSREVRSPWRAGFSTLAAFVICGLVPLLPYLAGVVDAFWPATALTAAVFFAIGALKSRWSLRGWRGSGLETLLVGAIAAALAYAAGNLLGGAPPV